MSGSETRSMGQGVSNTMKCVCVCVCIFVSILFYPLCGCFRLLEWSGKQRAGERKSGSPWSWWDLWGEVIPPDSSQITYLLDDDQSPPNVGYGILYHTGDELWTGNQTLWNITTTRNRYPQIPWKVISLCPLSHSTALADSNPGTVSDLCPVPAPCGPDKKQRIAQRDIKFLHPPISNEKNVLPSIDMVLL